MIFYDLMEEANGSALALRRRYFEGTVPSEPLLVTPGWMSILMAKRDVV
jgi:hypothetical protein